VIKQEPIGSCFVLLLIWLFERLTKVKFLVKYSGVRSKTSASTKRSIVSKVIREIEQQIVNWYGLKERRDGTLAVKHPQRVTNRLSDIGPLLHKHKISRTQAY